MTCNEIEVFSSIVHMLQVYIAYTDSIVKNNDNNCLPILRELSETFDRTLIQKVIGILG